jgi:hypothetical protein
MSEDTETASQDQYEKTTAFRWTEQAFTLLGTGKLHAEIHQPRPGVRVSHVWGQCPRCGHHLDDWQTLSAVTGLIGARRPDSTAHDTAVEPIDVGCGCGMTHPGTPPETTGCGVSFRIELEPIPSRDNATAGLLMADREPAYRPRKPSAAPPARAAWPNATLSPP